MNTSVGWRQCLNHVIIIQAGSIFEPVHTLFRFSLPTLADACGLCCCRWYWWLGGTAAAAVPAADVGVEEDDDEEDDEEDMWRWWWQIAAKDLRRWILYTCYTQTKQRPNHCPEFPISWKPFSMNWDCIINVITYYFVLVLHKKGDLKEGQCRVVWTGSACSVGSTR